MTGQFSDVRSPWHRFLEEAESLRPELYRYCRYLTRSPWDAEDLVQDTLARAFVTLGLVSQPIRNPRAWMFRVASNLWLNHVHRPRSEEAADVVDPSHVDPRVTREAAGTLMAFLSPQERAAVVLKDVFGYTLDEIAEVLSTSTGAIKAALHRGREKVAEPSEESRPTQSRSPNPAVLTAFTEAFNARDLERLTALLLDSVTVEFPGLHVEYGADVARKGSLTGVLYGNPASDVGGIPAHLRAGIKPQPPRAEVRVHRGEALVLFWFLHDDGAAVRAIARVEIEGDRISRLRTYLHQPDVLAETCRELGLAFRSSGYRHW